MAEIREEVKKEEKKQKQVEDRIKQTQPESMKLRDRARRYAYVVATV